MSWRSNFRAQPMQFRPRSAKAKWFMITPPCGMSTRINLNLKVRSTLTSRTHFTESQFAENRA
ncbi:Uncharacterised protein [Vibrio cholerae]|nr:Uncharacterised protein [Vibrio cholerae]